jgi:phenylacetyl-CoA:acceptor oxidoreductase subunit 2
MSDFGQFRGVAPWMQISWDMRAAGNFIGGGTGVGFLVVSFFTTLFLGTKFQLFTMIGLGFIGLGLFCVWLEIGRPFRAINVYFNPMTSWMSREAAISIAVFALGAGAIWLGDVVLFACTVLAAIGFLFCQAMIIKGAKGIPAWHHPMVVPLLMTTGLVEGCGLFFIVAPWVLGGTVPGQAVPAFVLLLAARWFVWRKYIRALGNDGAPVGAMRAFRKAHFVVFAIGSIMPTIVLALSFVMPHMGFKQFLFSLAGLTAMAAGWHLKSVLITKAAYNQGFAIPRSPSRGKGLPGPGAAPGWFKP